MPLLGVLGAHHLVLDSGFDDRSAKVILGVDRGRNLLAQLYGLGRCLDRDFKFRLLIFFNPE